MYLAHDTFKSGISTWANGHEGNIPEIFQSEKSTNEVAKNKC